MSRIFKSPEAQARASKAAGIVFLIVAATNWWIVIEDGASRARLIGAIAATVAALVGLFFPNRRRRAGERESTPDSE